MTQERAARGSHGHVVDQLDLARAREYALLANLLTRGPGTELIGRLALLQGDATPLGMAHAALAEAAGRSSQASAARIFRPVCRIGPRPNLALRVPISGPEIDYEGEELPDKHAAWREATVMAGRTDGKLQPGREWRMEVTDEFANALYVLHINAQKPK